MARPSVEPDHAGAAASRAREHARERGLYGTRVHFNDDWVPYADRGRWLLEADLGVSAHLDHLESRFSFRTRILDCLWASLPVVCTRGDALADIVEGRGLGATVAPGDAEGLASACLDLLDDPQRHETTCAAIAAAALDFRWSTVAQPLVDYCVNVRELEPLAGHPRAAAAATVAQYPDMVGEAYAAGGAGAAARRLGRNLARRLGSRG
jgi:glycosyltransferase involved in cell wall biosynthesis